MKHLNFTCPECGWKEIEEIRGCVTIVSLIRDVTMDDGECLEFDYSETANEGGEIERYQCGHCGHCVAVAGSDIRKRLEENGWLVENDECPVDSDGCLIDNDGDAETDMERCRSAFWFRFNAFDKDSCASHSKTVEATNLDDLYREHKTFIKEVPFSRWYPDHEALDDAPIVEEWLQAVENDWQSIGESWGNGCLDRNYLDYHVLE